MLTLLPARRLLIATLLAALVVTGTMLLGPQWIPLRDLFDPGDAGYIFWRLRVPRSLLAAIAGASLALGGVVFQTVFRNPLATPYTLGVASGASLAAALGFLVGWRQRAPGDLPVLTLLAFGGALGAMLLVWLVSRLRRQRDLTRLLLAGVCVAYMCSAGILLITYLADRAVTSDIVVWMMGSLDALRPRAALEILVVFVPALLIIIAQHRALDLLSFGENVAASRGVNVSVTIWSCYTVVGLLTGAVVANCGPIGFVGLMVPHLARPIFGVRALPLALGAAVIGAAFLAVCDGLARTMPLTELPVGVVTNIVGAAFFFYLLATQKA
jgi:iron complex transport system permease protein